MPKRKFINKKEATSFKVINRSLRDPLAVDETAPQHVLLPVDQTQSKSKDKVVEQMKFGIYFDDNYDYLQHIKSNDKTVEWVQLDNNKPEKSKSKIQLPSSVFASNIEEKEGFLNKAAPVSGLRLDLDRDIVATLEDDYDDFNSEDELDDNFVEMAKGGAVDVNEEDEEFNSDYDEDEDSGTEVNSNSDQENFSDNESVRSLTKSKLRDCDEKSYYSLVTNNPDKNPNLLFHEALFEMTKEDYNNSDSEQDEVPAAIQERNMAIILKEFENMNNNKVHFYDKDDDTIEITKKMLDNIASEEEYEEIKVQKKYVPKLYKSSKKYQPQLIEIPNDKPKKKKKQIVIEEELSSEESDTESIASRLSTLSIRPKDETPEEKRERKRGIKELRRVRRVQKKQNTLLYNEEKKRQVKNTQNALRMKRLH